MTDTATNTVDAVVDGTSVTRDLVIDTAMTVTEVEIAIDFSKVNDAIDGGSCGPPPVGGDGTQFNDEIGTCQGV